MDYPFVKCLNPQSIVNPYTNERLLVECGKCKACRIRKGAIASMKCKLESLSHKYTMFITLTYADPFLPLMDVAFSDKFNIPDYIVEHTKRFGVGVIIGEGDFNEKFIYTLKNKTNTKGYLPHLSKRDAQLFMKRLRKNIAKYETEKLRYYLVGEYGPVHFRPHLHLLLWFSSDKTYEVIRQAVSESWRYGRIDVEVSKGQSADYVAKYVNGNCSLPRIYQQEKTKPFALHSNHLGEMVLQKSKEEIYQLSAREVVLRSVPIGNKITSVNLWRSLKAFYFPRCKEYALRSESQRLRSYTIIDEAERIYNSESLTFIADSILSDICRWNEDYELFGKYLTERFDYDKLELLNYFLDSCKINAFDLYTRESFERYFRKVYMELRLSRHFVSFCCDNDKNKYRVVYGYIERFWKEVDYLNLVRQYEDMKTFCENWFSDESDLQMFYANVTHDMDEYKSKQYYKQLHFHTEQVYEGSVKHKKLNDMNNIFANK